jgi:hypothetical protein
MVLNAQIIKSELFQQLSEQEQENISSGGLSFFVKLTKISSSARTRISFSGISINIENTYTFTELLIGMDSSFSDGSRGRRRNISINRLLSLLSKLF